MELSVGVKEKEIFVKGDWKLNFKSFKFVSLIYQFAILINLIKIHLFW